MQYMIIGVGFFFVLALSLSPTSMLLYSKKSQAKDGQKIIVCTYFTGLGLMQKDFAQKTGVHTCPRIIKGLKK